MGVRKYRFFPAYVNSSSHIILLPLVRVSNLAQALKQLKSRGLWLVGLEAAASVLWHQVDLTTPTALLLGSEGRGLRRLTREHCDHLVSFPVHGEIGSINVSSAAAVALYEVVRQRALHPS